MTEFIGVCKGLPVYPCTTKELTLEGRALNWESELQEPTSGVFTDRFTGVVVEVRCGLTHATYTEVPGHPLEPEVLLDALKFLGPASGELESGAHTISLTGTDKLKTTSLTYKKVRAG